MERNSKFIVLRFLAGFIWLACALASAFCFGIVSGLRGCGDKFMEYPYYWYAVVFSYILCSGMLPAAYLMFGVGKKSKK